MHPTLTLLHRPHCLQVDRSNALAQARAADTTIVDLIDQGQAAIASNQAAIMAQLAVIIGKQVGGERFPSRLLSVSLCHTKCDMTAFAVCSISECNMAQLFRPVDNACLLE